MEEKLLKHRIVDWFKNRSETHPEILQSGKLRPFIPVEQMNPDLLITTDLDGVFLEAKDALLFDGLQADIYYAYVSIPSQPFGTVVATYEDGTLLWLDDHSSDALFVEFLRRDTFPLNDPKIAAQLLLETKFHYLSLGFKHVVVGKGEDIPRDNPEVIQRIVNEHKEMAEYYQEKEEKAVRLAEKLHEPTIVSDGNGHQLRFFIWTHVWGSIYQLSTTFGSDGSFSWQGERIADDIGKAFVPR